MLARPEADLCGLHVRAQIRVVRAHAHNARGDLALECGLVCVEIDNPVGISYIEERLRATCQVDFWLYARDTSLIGKIGAQGFRVPVVQLEQRRAVEAAPLRKAPDT